MYSIDKFDGSFGAWYNNYNNFEINFMKYLI